MKTFPLLPAAVLLLRLFTSPVHAQNYGLDWYTVDGGGGKSIGGVYTLTGTIGQPDAGTMSGGSYTLDGGFWGIVAAVQTPGRPTITVTRSGLSVIISWPSPSTSYVLQENANLATTTWTNVGQIPADNGGVKSVTLPSAPGNRFFRLRK